VIRGRPWLATVLFGFALAFKLQVVFIFPLLLVLALLKRLPWRSLMAVPAVYLALDLPALLLGASPERLLTVYSRQTETYQHSGRRRALTGDERRVGRFTRTAGRDRSDTTPAHAATDAASRTWPVRESRSP
jgi:hypothetical protein